MQHLDENQQGAKTIEKYEIMDNLTQTQTTRKITKKELRELIASQPPGFLADMLTN